MSFKKNLLQNYWISVIIPIILLWLILFLLGYPKPIPDDLFFIGAAINLVKNEEFSNPFLREWFPQTVDRFFVQPPFYSRILSFWLFVVDINTKSLLFFQFLCYVSFSITTSLILKKYGFAKIIAFLFVILYLFTFILHSGLRMDSLAMALLSLGLWFLIEDNNIRYFWGFFFLGSSILTSLIMIAYVIPFGIAILIVNIWGKQIDWKKYLITKFCILLSVVIILSTLFVISINGEITRFFSDLSWHSSLRREETIFDILNIPSPSRKIIILPLWFLTLSNLVYVLINKKIQLSDKFICLTFFTAIVFNFLIYVNSVSLFYQVNYFWWLLLILTLNSLFKIIPSYYRLLLITITICIFFTNQSINFLNSITAQKTPNEKYEIIKNRIKTLSPSKELAIDEVSARYIFDYNLPDNTFDWNWKRVGIHNKPKNRILVISPKKALWVKGLPDFEKAELFGNKFTTIPKYPDDLMIIE